MLSHTFWANYFESVNVARMRTLLEVLRDRVLPSFESVAEEAERKQQEAWDQMATMPCGEDGPLIDPGDVAEMARDAGLDHYQAMAGARQTIVSSFAIALYHLWEQQVLSFHRREVLHPRDRNNSRLLTLREFKDQLSGMNVDIGQFKSWPKLKVYRLLANAIKHAEGPAAVELKLLRPDWFVYPAFRNDRLREHLSTPSLYEPLAGEDLYIDAEDLDALVEAASDFWNDLLTALATESARSGASSTK
jgi:hypothetical protein